MDVLIKNAKFTTGELVSVKGVVFVISTLSQQPFTMSLQPANDDKIKEFLNDSANQASLGKPVLSEAKEAEPETTTLSTEVVPSDADVNEPPQPIDAGETQSEEVN